MNGFETVTSWFTPTTLFCILNLTILVIFFLNPNKKQQYPPPQLVRLPSFFDRSRSFNRSEQQPEREQERERELTRVPSLLERVKSIKLSVRSDPQPDPVHFEEPEPVHQEQVIRTKSETVKKAKKKVPKKVLKRSVSEKAPPVEAEEVVYQQRRPETVRESVAPGDAAVDEKADDFINKFRQQLKLQRLDSIIRYKEMLNRGASK